MLRYLSLMVMVISYLSTIPMILYGNLWQWLVCAAMYSFMLCLGTTVYFHRYLAHKSFECSRWLQALFLFFAHVGLQGSALQWVSMHRQHHRYAETEKDPHSPIHKGYFTAHFTYAPEINLNYVKDLTKDKMLVFEHQHYLKLMVVWAILLLLIDPFSIIYLWLAPVGLTRFSVGLILSYSHRGGYPHNDEWVGWITFGEGWHETHHDDPNKPMWHPTKDIGWKVIQRIQHDSKN